MTELLIKKDVIFSEIKTGINSGKYPPGYRFPSEPALAKEFGVSRITLRGAFKHLEENRLIVRLHGKGTFVPNARADKKKQKTYLILIYNISSNENPEIYAVPSFERYCERNNILTERLSVDILRALPEEHAVKMLKKENYDAILLCGHHYLGHEKELPILKALNIPILIPHSKPSDGLVTGFATMYNNYKQSNIDAIRFLKSKGHRNIITIGKPPQLTDMFLHGFELQEYIEFLTKEGFNPDPGLILLIEQNHEDLTNSLIKIFQRKERPTAVMCFSDFYAIRVYESLKALSLKIPEQVSVMGICAYPGGHMLKPPLSTVDFEYEKIGAKAFEIMENSGSWFNKKGTKAPEIISPHKIIVRESVAEIYDKEQNI